jgi:hypothetical protein
MDHSFGSPNMDKVKLSMIYLHSILLNTTLNHTKRMLIDKRRAAIYSLVLSFATYLVSTTLFRFVAFRRRRF